ncbi:MAG TPA: hypothetical protein VGK00_11755 [Anaerolineales bacterium]|jgi:hypothetical protein
MAIVGILEVAIGMIFSWLAMSLAGMYIQELIVSKLGWRANMLEKYLGNMLADPSMARQLYDHPLIKSLHSGSEGKSKPSYIPPSQFSMALVDIVLNAPKEAALLQKTLYDIQAEFRKLNVKDQPLAQYQLDIALNLTRRAIASEGGPELSASMLEDVKKLVRKLSVDFPILQPVIEQKFLDFAARKKMVDSLVADQRSHNNVYPDEPGLEKFRTGLAVMSITQPDLKQALEALINEIEEFGEKAENAILTMRKNIEDWFNSSMERLSGWYKRRAQTLAFIIGLSLAVVLNIDSVELATQLWRDPAVRQALAAQADALVNQNPQGFPNPDAGQLMALQMQISQLNIPVGWIGTGLLADDLGAVAMGDGTQKLCTLFPQSSVDLFGLHVGDQCYPVTNTPQLNDPTGWLIKLVGLLITGLAAAQGAPFWFDILKNVVNVRSSGAAPNTAK